MCGSDDVATLSSSPLEEHCKVLFNGYGHRRVGPCLVSLLREEPP